ncbi:MAG: sorting protein [Phycisphaerales bacterium]|nr:sorting protein [Phycisphaerales bacterium]
MKFASVKCGILAAAVLAAVGGAHASAQIVTQWTFDNQPVTGAPPYNNSPTPSTGSGTAVVLGMGIYPTPTNGFAAADILANPGSSTSPGGLPAADQAWRIRAQATAPAAANGWYSGAPQYTQGAEFDVPTTGFSGIKVSFDWQPTNKGVEDVELQYNPDVTNASGWVNGGLFSNTVPGGVWNNANIVDLSGLGSVANDPNFGIRIVSAYHPGTSAYADTTGAALNNSSGNIRFDNVTVSGVAPEPTSLSVLALGGLGLLARRRNRAGV